MVRVAELDAMGGHWRKTDAAVKRFRKEWGLKLPLCLGCCNTQRGESKDLEKVMQVTNPAMHQRVIWEVA